MYLQQRMEDEIPLLTSNHHHGHSKDFLPVCRRGNVTEADARQARHGEVQGSDVDGVLVRPTLPLPWTARVKTVRSAHRLSQDVEPAVHAHNVGFFINNLIITNAVPGAGRRRNGAKTQEINNQVWVGRCTLHLQNYRLYLC